MAACIIIIVEGEPATLAMRFRPRIVCVADGFLDNSPVIQTPPGIDAVQTEG